MSEVEREKRLYEAFERIETTILPCIAMMLETLLDASASVGETDPKALAAELQILAAELEELTRSLERSSPTRRFAISTCSPFPSPSSGTTPTS